MNAHVKVVPDVAVDIDGVVGDFDQHYFNLFGAYPKDETDPVMWGNIETEPTFWFDIPLKFGAMELFEIVKPYNPFFLTGVPNGINGERAHEQKPEWVKKHFGAQYPVVTTRSRIKQTHMRKPGDILVDDRWHILKKWKAYRGPNDDWTEGGVAVHYRDAYQAMSDMKRALGLE